MISGGSSSVRISSSLVSAARVMSCRTAASCSASSAGSGRGRRSFRISGGSVIPCTASVPATTTNAASTSTARCGVSAGSTNAAARVTTPRMPAQAMTAE